MKTKQLKFKVGDRVKIIKTGLIGTIEKIESGFIPSHPYRVIFGFSDCGTWYSESQLEPSIVYAKFMCITRVCGVSKLWLNQDGTTVYDQLDQLDRCLDLGFLMISESEFMQKLPPKPEPLKLFGYDVKMYVDNVRVGCKMYNMDEVNAFVRIAQDLINVVADNIINEIDIIKIKETLKKLQS